MKNVNDKEINNVNDKEINNVIYEGYKILDNRKVTADIILPALDCLPLFSKIRLAQNIYDIIDKLQENNDIYIKHLLEDIEREDK